MALQLMQKEYKHTSKEEQLAILVAVKEHPETYLEDEKLRKIADEFIERNTEHKPVKIPQIRTEPEPYPVFGKQFIDQNTIRQMDTAMRLPVSKAGALMPDAHVGYGLPVGGVLATENEIIPYAVGLDIGCRMSLSIFPEPVEHLQRYSFQMKQALVTNTHFGIGKKATNLMEHEVLDREEFATHEVLKQIHGKAFQQLGTSGSGNHFVELGAVHIRKENTLGLPEGSYLGLLSHSGSRGLGATVAGYYTRVAMDQCKLPKGFQHLAWLDLNTEAGQAYWIAMNLAGDYAKACHDVIHQKISKELGIKPMLNIENHHNFAWKEKMSDGETLLVHRKGATPAAKGIRGVIPGSMVAPGYIVSGKGKVSALESAAHGAGRKLSRQKARSSITGSYLRKVLKKNDITLVGGGVDEAPDAYKDLEQVMKSQQDLVHVEGSFHPKIVRMDKN